MALSLLGLFALAFVIAVAAVPFARRRAIRQNFFDVPAENKVHREPVPYGGGSAVVYSVVAVVALGYGAIIAHQKWDLHWAPEAISRHFDGALSQFQKVGILLICALVIHILGVIDDRRGLSARVKLAVQLGVGALFALSVEPVSMFLDDGVGLRIVQIIITAVWIAAVTNMFNFLDHMDGICAGVAVIVSAAFVAVAVQTNQLFLALMLTVLMGSCAGFLIFNIHPARIFLGDGGSLFIGFMLGALTTVFTFYSPDPKYLLYQYLAPLAVLAVPVWDAAMVVWIRLRTRRPIYRGDRNHLAHRLVALGMTPRGAAGTIYVLTLYTAVSAVLLYFVENTDAALLVLAQVAMVFLLMRILELTGRAKGGGTTV